MTERTVREFLDLLADQNILSELRGKGTHTETQDWVLKKVSEIALIDLEIQQKRELVMQLEMERDRLVLNNPELRALVGRISEITVQRKSLEVKMSCDFAQLLTVIATKLEDVMGRMGFVEEGEKE